MTELVAERENMAILEAFEESVADELVGRSLAVAAVAGLDCNWRKHLGHMLRAVVAMVAKTAVQRVVEEVFRSEEV